MKKTISKSKLKARMLELFRDLETNGGELIVTDHDRPVLRIVPIHEMKTAEELFGHYWGKVIYNEDVNAPTSDEWEALQ